MYGENLLPCCGLESVWYDVVTPVATIKICDDSPFLQKVQAVDAWLLKIKRCTQVHLFPQHKFRFDGPHSVSYTDVFVVGDAAAYARVQSAMANIPGIGGTIELKPYVDPATTDEGFSIPLDIAYGNPEFTRKRHKPIIDPVLSFVVV
jgi:hypothetical protein